jgi:glycerate 2-kinase
MSGEWNDERARTVLRRVFDAAVASADPRSAVARHLPEKPRGRCVVVGAGKASAAMAAGLDAAWPDVELSGVVVTRYGYAVAAGRIEILEAAHPLPDESSVAAARRMLDAVSGLGSDDLVVALVSGGGSALMTLPAGAMTLADKQTVNAALLASGAPISEMNVLRKHLSGIKGGRLAAAARPARVVTLVISDIPGDDPAAIASGPTLPDTSTKADALKIPARWSLDLPPAARAVLEHGDETPKPGDIETNVRIIAAPSLALTRRPNSRGARDSRRSFSATRSKVRRARSEP